MKPNFELVEDEHEFKEGDEIYLIDNNKTDIYKGKINKVNKKGYSVMISDFDENNVKKVLSPKRLLLMTPTNNEIYEQQQEIRKQSIEKDKEEKEKEKSEEVKEGQEKEENSDPTEQEAKNEVNDIDAKEEKEEGDKQNNEEESKNCEDQNGENDQKEEEKVIDDKIKEIQAKSSFKKIKRKKKVKKPIFDQQTVVKAAWHNGIHEVNKFKRFMKKNIKSLVSAFEKYQIMMNVAEEQPFSLGLNLSDHDITKFWTTARNQWKKMFEDAESVRTEEFIKKTASTFKLQNQMESNAREALRFFFDTESSSNETNFFQFCALLALFGPTQTMFRKIGHFLQCPPSLKDSFAYNDVNDIREPDQNIYLNEFVFFAGTSREKIFYNMPFTSTDKQYIVDEEGNKYDSWLKIYDEVANEKVEEETATIESPPEIPIEAS